MNKNETTITPKKKHDLYVTPLLQAGFNSPIRTIRLEETTIAVLSEEGLLMLFDKKTLEQKAVILETTPLRAIRNIKPTSLKAYTHTGELHLYDLAKSTSQKVSTKNLPNNLKTLHETHKYIVFLQKDAISVYDKRTKTFTLYNYPANGATAVTLWEDLCFIGLNNGDIEVIDLFHKENIYTLHGHKQKITGLVFWDYKLISSSLDETIKAWDPISYSEIHTIDGIEAITSLTSKDNILVAGSESGIIRLFDLNTFKLITTLWGHIVEITALQMDNDLIVSGGENGEIRIWDATLYNELKHIPPAKPFTNVTGNRHWIVTQIHNTFHIWKYFQTEPTHEITLPLKEFKDMGIYEGVLLIRDKKTLYTIELDTGKQVKISKKIKHKNAHQYYEYYPTFITQDSLIIAKFIFEKEKEYFDQLLLQKTTLTPETLDHLQKILDPIPNKAPYVKHTEQTYIIYPPYGITQYFATP